MDDFKQSHWLIKIHILILILLLVLVISDATTYPLDKFFGIQLGQNFIVGISQPFLDIETRNILEEIKPAGIVIYSRNIKSYDQIQSLIKELQSVAHSSTDYPYFIMVDEEPSGAGRLKVFQYVFPAGIPDWGSIELGIKTMAEAGINVNLAPLADYPFNNNAFLKNRIPPVESPKELINFNRQFIGLLHRHGLSGTLKHFPGMGVFDQDPHSKTISTEIDPLIFKESLDIFYGGISSGVDFIMSNHASYNNVDPDKPVTLSKRFIIDILKEKLKFEGIIITDDLSEMPVINNRERKTMDIAYNSIMAGHHLLMYSHRLKKTLRIVKNLISRCENDQILKNRVLENYDKIIAFKKAHLSN